MNTPFDQKMGRVFEPFERDHNRLRTELMASLPAETPSTQHSHRRRQWKEIPITQRRIIRFGIIAAAAVIVIAFLNLKTDQKGDGIAWADVVNRMNRAKTLIVSGTRNWQRQKFKIYMKDPRLVRMEEWPISASQPEGGEVPDHITVQTASGAEWQSVAWRPYARTVTRGRDDWCSPPGQVGQYVTELWLALRRLSSDDLNNVDESSINGQPVVIFEVPSATYHKALQDERDAKIDRGLPEQHELDMKRVYVSKNTALPIRVETNRAGIEIGKTDFEWDVPLGGELFQIPSFDESWTITDYRTVCFSNHTLKAGNTLHLSPPDGPAILTEADIASIQRVAERTMGGHRQLVTVWCILEDEAGKRFGDYARAHPNDKLITILNGEELSQTDIYLQVLRLSVGSLDITLEEFEQKYLESKPPDSAPAQK